MDFETIKEEVKNILSEKRYQHSLGVVERGIELAKIYQQDIEKIKIIAMAHDIAKEMTPTELYQYAQEHHLFLDEIEKKEPSIVHAKIGADICKHRYGFTQDMVEAVCYHTTGNIAMDTVAKIIMIADKTEAGRKMIDLQTAVEITNQDLEEGLLHVCAIAITYNIKKKSLLHPDTIELMNQIILDKNSITNKRK